MPQRSIVFDVTRLLTRLRLGAPTGIDRVDLTYAEHFLLGPPNAALSVTSLGPRLLVESATRALLDALRANWREEARSSSITERLAGWLAKAPSPPPAESLLGRRPGAIRGIADLSFRTLAASRQAKATSFVPRDAVYLHSSHLRLDRPRMFDWLSERPDVQPVFFVHDLIPIEYPEYGIPGEADRHRIRMATVARHAAAVIANSEAVAESFRDYTRTTGLRRVPRVVVAPIGIEAQFLAPAQPLQASRPYFVVCSTIEARKNHLLLLQIWRDLARSLPSEKMPALVVVGRRGWESEAAIDLLDRCEAIRPHVIEAPNLPTHSLASVMAGARALLMPSFAEGYGIPVAEALGLGVPVIASDLAAHREITRGAAILLDPLDGPAWRRAILEAAARPLGERQPGPAPTWADHLRIVENLITGL